MPLYLYRCPNCHKEFDAYQNLSEENAGKFADCPQCGHVGIRKYTPIPSHLFVEGFDMGLGKYVSSERDLKNKIRETESEYEKTYGVPLNVEIRK